jgi:hypothetical protein
LNRGIEEEYGRELELEKLENKMHIKRISFNNLRLEEPMSNPNLSKEQRMKMIAPMITNSSMNNFGKYDVAETYM